MSSPTCLLTSGPPPSENINNGRRQNLDDENTNSSMSGKRVVCEPSHLDHQASNKHRPSRSQASSYSRFVRWVRRWLTEYVLKPTMLSAARFPCCWIIGVVLLSILLPLMSFRTDSIMVEIDFHDTGVPATSIPLQQAHWIIRRFVKKRVTPFLIHANGENALTTEAIRLQWDLEEKIEEVLSRTKYFNGDGSSICSITKFWKNREAFEDQIRGASSHEMEASIILDSLSEATFHDGTPRPELSDLMGHVEQDKDGFVLSALSIRTRVQLQEHNGSVGVLEDLLINIAEHDIQPPTDGLYLEVGGERLRDRALAEPIFRDLPLVYASFLLMAMFTAITMSRCRRGSRRCLLEGSHGALGIGATLCVALSMMTGYSICTLAGYKITLVTQVLPFVLVGIGLDDSFILVGALDAVERDHDRSSTISFQDKLKKVAETAGLSVTATSMTDCLAFALGAVFTSVPAIVWFCFYAVVCVFVDFVYQMTFFIALMALDDQRIRSDRYDFICCIKAAPPAARPSSEGDNEKEEEASREVATRTRTDHALSRSSTRPTMRNGWMVSYSRVLLKPLVKIVVILVSVFTFVMGAIFASKASLDFNLRDLVTPGSPYDRFAAADLRFFADVGGGLAGNVYLNNINMSDPTVWDEVDIFLVELVNTGYVEFPSTRYWLDDFRAYLLTNSSTYWTDMSIATSHQDENSTTEMIRMAFEDFLSLESTQERYAGDIIANLTTGELIAARIPVTLLVDRYNLRRQVDMFVKQWEITLRQPMNNRHQEEERTTKGAEAIKRMFLFHQDFPLFEHVRLLARELTSALVSGTLAVGIVAAIFFSHPIGIAMSVLVVAMVNVELVGVVYLAGKHITTITVVLLIMAVGLVVDYCLHVIHTVLSVRSKHPNSVAMNQIIPLAMQEVAASVLQGGLSTLLGILSLSLAKGEVFQTFFIMFVAMVLLGLGHGLIFVPVALSLLLKGGSGGQHQQEDNNDDSSSLSSSSIGGNAMDETASRSSSQSERTADRKMRCHSLRPNKEVIDVSSCDEA